MSSYLGVVAASVVAAAIAFACREAEPVPRPARSAERPTRPPAPDAALAGATPAAAIEVVAVEVPSAPPAFVLRGARGNDKMAFLHGLCGHAQGYAQSFQFSAARFGVLVAPQGDLACSEPWRSWSGDLRAVETRILEAFSAAGVRKVENALLIGYSQGATRAEALARKQPHRYSRLILIGAPETPSPRGLRELRGAVMMAGSRDRQDRMRAGERAFRAAGIPATYRVLPGAAHGEMGPEAERVMGEALAWLRENAR